MNSLAKKILEALVLTMFVAAFFHMCLLMVAAVISSDINYLNPLYFLGITLIKPDLQNSTIWLLIGWIILVIIFIFMVFLINKLNYVAAWFYGTKTYRNSLIAVDKIKSMQEKNRIRLKRQKRPNDIK